MNSNGDVHFWRMRILNECQWSKDALLMAKLIWSLSLTEQNRMQWDIFPSMPARPDSRQQFSMDLGRKLWITYRTSGLWMPMPKATVAQMTYRCGTVYFIYLFSHLAHCVRVCVCVCVYIYVYVCVYVCVCVYVYLCIYIYMYVYMYICVCMCLFNFKSNTLLMHFHT